MEHAFSCRVRGDLLSARQDAASFLDNFAGETSRQDWIAEWRKIGDHHYVLGDLKVKRGALDEATEAWLCALTAFEIVKRLVEEGDPQSGDVSAKVDLVIERLESSPAQQIERVKITCCDGTELLAYYVPAGNPDAYAPAVICISSEQETGAALLGRLLPVVIGQGLSVLFISHEELSARSRNQSVMMLSCCLDYLSARPEINADQIAIYGEGLSAALATDFAAADRRLAAAVCDGGLWNWARLLASVGWLTKDGGAGEESITSALRSQLLAQLKCPVLVVAGGRGIVSVSEAITLQDDCMASIDLELTVPRVVRTRGEEIENFVASDECVFRWLEQKLLRSSVV